MLYPGEWQDIFMNCKFINYYIFEIQFFNPISCINFEVLMQCH